MGRLQTTARWVVLVFCLGMAALYLNSSLYSAWVSSGPPNPHPEAWLQRALVHLCFAGTFSLVGIAIFRLVTSFPKVGFLTAFLGALSLLLLAIPYAREFLLSAACLDNGGRWNKAEFRCEK
jgi:hypothetical protein